MLAGGLGPENVGEAIAAVAALGRRRELEPRVEPGHQGPRARARVRGGGADDGGWYGEYGGRYVPGDADPGARRARRGLAARPAADPSSPPSSTASAASTRGRPTPLTLAERFPPGKRLYLKREDLLHTGAHKLNNALGQAVLARRLGKPRIVAETGAGQHGVATATVCARFGLECVVYMGAEDMRRQRPNVERMGLLGAEVRPVEFGTQTLKEATSEAIRDWITNVETTHYLIGSCVGPHPYPEIVRELQAVIGREAREQFLDAEGRLPDAVVACVGGGSNAIGMFAGFLDDAEVRLFGVEAAGAASLGTGRAGVLHGARSSLLADEDGQIVDAHSISAGLDYPGVGPEHAYLRDSAASSTWRRPTRRRSPPSAGSPRRRGSSPRSSPPTRSPASAELDGDVIVVCLSGRGDKDLDEALAHLGSASARHTSGASKALVIYLMAGRETPELAAAAEAGGADTGRDRLSVLRSSRRRAGDPPRGRTGARGRDADESVPRVPGRRRAARVVGAPVPMTYSSLLEAYGWRALCRRRARGRRDQPDRRRPARRGAARASAAFSSLLPPRPTSGSRSPASRPTAGCIWSPLTGTTGARAELSPALAGLVERARSATGKPLYAGFGISTPQHAATAAALTDGVVVGSRALEVAEEGPAALRAYVGSLRAALDA